MFTILSLWIPLAPLFWLMYKQFSSGNSSNQKKRLGSIPVKFEDVAGVDEAKIELVEVFIFFLLGAFNVNLTRLYINFVQSLLFSRYIYNIYYHAIDVREGIPE